MSKEIITIKSSPATLEADFEQAEKKLRKKLKKYDVVVTLETLAGGKELATELNATAKLIDDKRKEAVSEASAPIKDFDEKMKSLVNLCKDERIKLLDQVKVFEDKTRATIKQLMIDLRKELYDLNEVEDRFKTLMFPASVPLNYLTGTGNLSGKIKSEIKAGVLADLQVQKDVEMRLVKLENESYKAGLKSPLSEVHVQAFLMDDEPIYQQKLDELLAVEVNRQEESEKRIREQVAKEELNKDHPLVEPAPVSTSGSCSEQASATVVEAVEKPVAPAGKTVRVLQARFEVVALPHIKTEQIIEAMTKAMSKAGITSLKSLTEVK